MTPGRDRRTAWARAVAHAVSISVVAVIVFVALAVSGCTASEGGEADGGPGGRQGRPETVTLDWRIEPRRVGPAELEIVLAENGEPIRGAEIDVVASMSHAGMQPSHGSAIETGLDATGGAEDAEPGAGNGTGAGTGTGTGVYVAPLELTMAGDWYVTFDIRLADGRAWTEDADLPGVASADDVP